MDAEGAMCHPRNRIVNLRDDEYRRTESAMNRSRQAMPLHFLRYCNRGEGTTRFMLKIALHNDNDFELDMLMGSEITQGGDDVSE